MRKIPVLAMVFLLVAGVCATQAASNQANRSRISDRQLVKRAASDSHLKAAAANLALSQSQNAGIQEFATIIMTNHLASLEQMQSLASEMGIELPDAAPENGALERLGGLEGSEFNRAFLDFNIRRNTQSILFLQLGALRARDAAVRRFARSQLPVLAEQLRMALELRETATGEEG